MTFVLFLYSTIYIFIHIMYTLTGWGGKTCLLDTQISHDKETGTPTDISII